MTIKKKYKTKNLMQLIKQNIRTNQWKHKKENMRYVILPKMLCGLKAIDYNFVHFKYNIPNEKYITMVTTFKVNRRENLKNPQSVISFFDRKKKDFIFF